MISENIVNFRVCLIVLWACVACGCFAQSVSPSNKDDVHAVLESSRAAIKSEKSIKRGSWVLAFGSAKPASDSSSSHRAAMAAARMDAIGNIVRAAILERIGDELRTLPQALRSNVVEIISRNYNGRIRIELPQVLEEGEDKNGVWVFIAVPVVAVIYKDLPASIKECLVGVALGPGNKIKALESDYFYEVSLMFGVPDAKAAWIRSHADLLTSQLAGDAIPHGIRFWVDHRKEVMRLLPDLEETSDIKKAIIALPYCKDLFDLLSSALTAKGLTNVANEVGRLRPAVACSAVDKVNDPDLEKELALLGVLDDMAIKVIISFDGQFPEKGEESKPSYHEAFAAYTKADFKAAIPLCLKAVSESYNADTINLLGAIARQCGLNRLGAILCRQALFIDSQQPYASVNVAICYELLGSRALAEEYAKKTISSKTADDWAKSEATRILNNSK